LRATAIGSPCAEVDWKFGLSFRVLLAVDGTRTKAVSNKDRNFTRKSLDTFIKAADERPADYLRRLDEGDAAERGGAAFRVTNLAEKIAALSKKRADTAPC
jgi:hypothetical protein